MKNLMTTTNKSLSIVALSLAGIIAASGANASAQDSGHPLVKAIKHATACRDKARDLGSYEAKFTKKEIVGRKMISNQMLIKVRSQPFSVYMKFIEPEAGQQVVFNEGKNSDKLTVKPVGIKSILGSLELAPNSSTVMKENRHPITSMGMERTVDSLITQWKAESRYGEVDVKYYPNAKLNDRNCKVIEAIHPQPRKQFTFHKTRLYIDSESGLPVRVEQFGFPSKAGAKPPIVEQYTYSGIRRNGRLADLDFSTRNPKYGF